MRKQTVYQRRGAVLLAAWMLLGSVTGCGQAAVQDDRPAVEDVTVMDAVELEDEAVALAEAPEEMPAAMPTVVSARLSGVLVRRIRMR